MAITPESNKYHSTDSNHFIKSSPLLLWRKSRLGLSSTTPDDLMAHSTNRHVGRKSASVEVFASMTGFAQNNLKQHHLLPSPRLFTLDFEETLFRTSSHPASSTRPIQMVADVKYKGGRCKLPFYAHTCHNMWVGAVVMGTDVVVPVCKRYQVCLMHRADSDVIEMPMESGNCLLDANGNKRCCVMAGKPMLIDCPSSMLTNTEDGSSIVRLCHYQSGRLLQGIQLFTLDGQTIASPIRLVFSFTEVDQVFCTESCGEAALTKRPIVKSVYRCSAPINGEDGLLDVGTNRSPRGIRRIEGEQGNANLPPH